jgi:glycosyltransferase involved in cell wall biosynthesis
LLARPETVFVWLGDGELLQALRQKVQEMSMEERILLPGYVEYPATWYARACIYIQPSLRESHGIAVLEAMTQGLPCVVADTGGLPESVVDNETGFVCPPGDVTGLSGRVLELLGDAALRERMGTAGRLRAEQFFSEAVQERKILELYDKLTGKMDRR